MKQHFFWLCVEFFWAHMFSSFFWLGWSFPGFLGRPYNW
jgi:hypothetical protein